jgi:hypothetical protein
VAESQHSKGCEHRNSPGLAKLADAPAQDSEMADFKNRPFTVRFTISGKNVVLMHLAGKR